MKHIWITIFAISSIISTQAQAQYLYARGMFKSEINQERQQEDAIVSAISSYDARLVRKVQSALLRLGYAPGPADGMMGPKTERAIREFQQDNGLQETGVPTWALLSRLNAGSVKKQPADQTPRPSFDCARAGTMVEHLICNSVALAERDRQIAALYSEALAKSGTPGNVRAKQRAWIEERDRCGGSEGCLAHSMDTRIAELHDTSLQPPPQGSDDPANASYSVPVDSGVMMTKEEAAAANCDMDVEVCFKPYKAHDTLNLSTTPNGNLEYAIRVNAFNGHMCMMEGTAQKTGTANLWHDKQRNDRTVCKINIKIGPNAVTVKQDKDSDCSYFCGARAYLAGEFPMSSMIHK